MPKNHARIGHSKNNHSNQGHSGQGAMFDQEQNRNQQDRLAKLLEKERKQCENLAQNLLNIQRPRPVAFMHDPRDLEWANNFKHLDPHFSANIPNSNPTSTFKLR